MPSACKCATPRAAPSVIDINCLSLASAWCFFNHSSSPPPVANSVTIDNGSWHTPYSVMTWSCGRNYTDTTTELLLIDAEVKQNKTKNYRIMLFTFDICTASRSKLWIWETSDNASGFTSFTATAMLRQRALYTTPNAPNNNSGYYIVISNFQFYLRPI